MPKRRSLPTVYRNQALPECQGPKLHPLSRLGPANDDGSGINSSDGLSGAHGFVFKVLVESKFYALKLFRFFDHVGKRSMLTQIENDSVTDDTLICHTDPFYAECRAYGRIEEDKRKKKLRRDLVVPCYGFLGIAPEQEKMLVEQFGGRPIRALMKELIEEETSLTDQTLKRMLRDLRALRRIGIYPRDIAARSYRGGRLVDFGASCTEPYVLFQICPKWQVDFWKTEDLAMFDEMIEDESIETEVRATPNHEYRKKLRPRKQTTDEE